MTKRLAIVPARGGSKRIPRKNIRTFHGAPMISHILTTARHSALFSDIHVSTDDDEIAKTCAELGFAPKFDRPDHLSDDATPIMQVLKYVAGRYQEFGQMFDEIWMLMACAPLLTSDDLNAAALIMNNHESSRPLLGVCEYPVPVEWAFDLEADNQLTPRQPGMFAVSSQSLGTVYYDAGAFAAFPADHVLSSEGAGNDLNFIGQVLPKSRVVDIDTEEDWKLAEALYSVSISHSDNGD